MCGLIGFVGTQSPIKIAKSLILAGMVRGVDAAGYCEIDDNGKYHIEKRAEHPIQFSEHMKGYALDRPVTWLGHTRKSTCGGDDDNAAHPFNGQRFILFHNGYLVKSDWEMVEKTFDLKAPNGVDSELFVEFLNKFGNIEAMKFLLLPLLGPNSRFMFVIYDKFERKIHFIKDSEQPFVYRLTDKGLFYASTPAILQAGIDSRYMTFDNILKYPVVEFPADGHIVADARTGKIESVGKCIKNIVFNSAMRYKTAV